MEEKKTIKLSLSTLILSGCLILFAGVLIKINNAFAQNGNIGEAQLLARAINGEARGEPYEGKVAVGAVIINRTKDPNFPKTIAGVIYQPGAFTAVNDGQINIPIESGSEVVKAAQDALSGWDPTDGCVYSGTGGQVPCPTPGTRDLSPCPGTEE